MIKWVKTIKEWERDRNFIIDKLKRRFDEALVTISRSSTLSSVLRRNLQDLFNSLLQFLSCVFLGMFSLSFFVPRVVGLILGKFGLYLTQKKLGRNQNLGKFAGGAAAKAKQRRRGAMNALRQPLSLGAAAKAKWRCGAQNWKFSNFVQFASFAPYFDKFL